MVKWIVLWSWSDVWLESLKLITICFTHYFTNSITTTFRNCITCFHNMLSRKIPKRDKESRRVTMGACRVKVGRRRGAKEAKSVLYKDTFDRYTLPRTTAGHSGTVCRAPKTQRRQLHSVLGPKDDSCIVHEAPETTVAQFARPQRRQLHSLQGPKDDSCTVWRLPSVDRTTVAQFQGLTRANWSNLGSRRRSSPEAPCTILLYRY